MSKRLLSLIGVLACLLLLAAPTLVQAEPYAYSEGIHFYNARGYTIAHSTIEVTATKMVEGDWRETWVHVVYHGPGSNPWYIDDTAKLIEDPDCLEVSRDLGWGGLCGYVMVYERTYHRYVRIDFNISQFARVRRYTYDPATYQFRRAAYLGGYMLIGGSMRDFDWPITGANYESAYNFSDQWPGY